jgi:hypothetical protein
LITCPNIDAVIQGIECDVLVRNIIKLINKINKEHENLTEETRNEPKVKNNDEEKIINTTKPEVKIINNFKYSPKSEFNGPYKIYGDGWCLYRALIRGKSIANNRKNMPDGFDRSDQWDAYELDLLKTEVMPKIVEYMKANLDNKITNSSNKGESSTLRQMIEYETVKPDSKEENIYVSKYKLMRKNEGKNEGKIAAEDYIARMSNFDTQPTMWGQPQIIVPIFIKLYNVNVEQYELIEENRIPDGVTDNKNDFMQNNYMKTDISSDIKPDTLKNTIYLLYNGSNHYDLLISKNTKSEAKSGGARPLMARRNKL